MVAAAGGSELDSERTSSESECDVDLVSSGFAFVFLSFLSLEVFVTEVLFPLSSLECVEDIIVGGSCNGSPASISFFPFNIGIQHT